MLKKRKRIRVGLSVKSVFTDGDKETHTNQNVVLNVEVKDGIKDQKLAQKRVNL